MGNALVAEFSKKKFFELISGLTYYNVHFETIFSAYLSSRRGTGLNVGDSIKRISQRYKNQIIKIITKGLNTYLPYCCQ
jgi:arabinogalactan endo-1,4-beta-galactosidase